MAEILSQTSPQRLLPHAFDPYARRCRHCFVPETAVLDDMVIEGCAAALTAAALDARALYPVKRVGWDPERGIVEEVIP